MEEDALAHGYLPALDARRLRVWVREVDAGSGWLVIPGPDPDALNQRMFRADLRRQIDACLDTLNPRPKWWAKAWGKDR